MIAESVSFPDSQANLNYDDELLRRADKGEGGEALRLWESPVHFVVLGRTCLAEEDVELEAAKRDKIMVLRRSSGGGTVLQGPGCLNFAFVLAKKRHPDMGNIHKSYAFILGKVISALKDVGVAAEFRPISDLTLRGTEKKFSGNAQRRGREFILHHGTILYNFELSLISRYLKVPKKMPDYRKARPHEDFLTNVPVLPKTFLPAIQATFAL